MLNNREYRGLHTTRTYENILYFDFRKLVEQVLV